MFRKAFYFKYRKLTNFRLLFLYIKFTDDRTNIVRVRMEKENMELGVK